ncbi:MAG: hemerythrin domain-containing protein [Deltaproteobacteria bacterium]|nr:hemerythrin domain-containing protein [Deltaproteobacteria bacterium]
MPVAPDDAPPDALFAEARGALERGDRRHARASIESLMSALEAHFALEDRVYFPSLCALQPGVEPDVRVLQREHGKLREHLASIASRLDAQEDPADLMPSFQGLVSAFREHEVREESILVAVESGLTEIDTGPERSA